MSERKKTKDFENIKIFNADLIFSCAVYLLNINQLDFTSLLNYELAPIPTSLFKDTVGQDIHQQNVYRYLHKIS